MLCCKMRQRGERDLKSMFVVRSLTLSLAVVVDFHIAWSNMGLVPTLIAPRVCACVSVEARED